MPQVDGAEAVRAAARVLEAAAEGPAAHAAAPHTQAVVAVAVVDKAGRLAEAQAADAAPVAVVRVHARVARLAVLRAGRARLEQQRLGAADGAVAAELLDRLFRRHHARVAAWCLRLSGRREEAADLAQEVFLRVYERLDGFRFESRFSTWLYQMVMNACRDYRRRQRTTRSMQDGYAVVQGNDAADWADSDRKIRWLYLALDRLKPDLKETALLILAEDMTQDDAAAILGISAGTVAWRMSEVKKRLRAMAESDDERA